MDGDRYLLELAGGKPISFGLANIGQNRQNFAEMALAIRTKLADPDAFFVLYPLLWDAKDAIGALYASAVHCPIDGLPAMPEAADPCRAENHLRALKLFIFSVEPNERGDWFELMRQRATDKLDMLAVSLRAAGL